jgi:hypothetical protein
VSYFEQVGQTVMGRTGSNFVVVAAFGLVTVVFLKTGIASLGRGWSKLEFSRSGNPVIYWIIVAICAAITLYSLSEGLRGLM